MQRIGERIKKRREQLKLNLNELAEKVGISSSALSQIENAKSYPSLITLKAIADKLHTTVGELIGENESLANNPVVYKKDIRFIDINPSGTQFFLLSHHDLNKQMDTYLVRFAESSSLENYFQKSFGQVFCFILQGELKFVLDEENYILKPGDSMYFNARSSYEAVNISHDITEMLWIQSPPHF
jgi:transcriptional regulator with XRE-family HTH domain